MKIIKRLFCVCFLLLFSVCLTACDSTASVTCKNGHGIDKEWHTDSTSHYMVCDKCGDVVQHKHNFKWVVTAEAKGTLSEIKSEFCADCGYFAGRVESLDTWDGTTITKRDVLRNKIKASNFTDSKDRGFYSISVNTAADLVAAFKELDDHKNFSIVLTGDIDVSAGDWVSGIIDGAMCGDVEIIIDGNYHKLIGINKPLIEKITTGNTKIVVRNLTIEDADIDVQDNAGAIIGAVKGANNILIDGCNIDNSNIVGKNNIGGFIGIASGNSFIYDKVFTNIEIKNSSINNSSIGGNGLVGAVIGMATNDAWTKVTVKDCAIVDNRITSTSNNNDYAGVVVGSVGIAGTAKTVSGTTHQGGVYLLNIVENDNIVSSYLSDIDRWYGNRSENTAQLYIDGVKQF